MLSAFSQSAVAAGPLVGVPGSLIASGRTVTWTVDVACTDDRGDDEAVLPVVGLPVVGLPVVGLPVVGLTAAGSAAAGPVTAAAAAMAAVTAVTQEARVILARLQAP
jgi:hypothetical protein